MRCVFFFFGQAVLFCSCVLAFFLNYSIFLNTTLNSALTQTICGNLKVCFTSFPLHLANKLYCSIMYKVLYGTVTFSGALVIFKLVVLPKAVLGGSNASNVWKDCDLSHDLTYPLAISLMYRFYCFAVNIYYLTYLWTLFLFMYSLYCLLFWNLLVFGFS